MAAPTLVQSNWAEGSSVTSLAVTLSVGASGADVTSGNTLVAAIAEVAGDTRSLSSLADDNGGVWNIDETMGASKYTRAIGSADNVSSGATQITATMNVGSNIAVVVAELSGADSADSYDTSDSFDDTDNSDANHYCASSPGIGTASDVFLVAVDGASVGTVGNYVAPSGWTIIRSSTTHGSGYAVAYYTSASALTNERAVFTQTGTNRTSKGAVASYKAAAGGSVLPLLDHHYRTMRS